MKLHFPWKSFYYTLPFAIVLCVFSVLPVLSSVIEERDRTYIIDQTGERWEVTQAKSIGFDPRKFQFGIGRYAFTPLDDSYWNDTNEDVPQGHRVIGVTEDSEAQAYSVSRLAHHEIANTTLGSKPIAAGFWPLVGLAAVYSREIDGKILTLAPSGWTYNHTFVLYDRETGTLWYPSDKGLMGIQGVYFKRWLREIPSITTRWRDWVAEHPHSKIMK